jgi:hypothetical protein
MDEGEVLPSTRLGSMTALSRQTNPLDLATEQQRPLVT